MLAEIEANFFFLAQMDRTNIFRECTVECGWRWRLLCDVVRRAKMLNAVNACRIYRFVGDMKQAVRFCIQHHFAVCYWSPTEWWFIGNWHTLGDDIIVRCALWMNDNFTVTLVRSWVIGRRLAVVECANILHIILWSKWYKARCTDDLRQCRFVAELDFHAMKHYDLRWAPDLSEFLCDYYKVADIGCEGSWKGVGGKVKRFISLQLMTSDDS